MKKVVSYFSLTSMVTNNFCNQYCDKFKFKIEEQNEKDKKQIFDQICNLLKSKGISKYLDLGYSDKNDSFFVTITKDGIEFFDILEDVASRYNNISQLRKCFEINFSSMVFNKYDYEQSEKYISKIKTKKIVYNNTNVESYSLEKRLAELKKTVFLDKDYGFYILKDGYSNFIKKEFPEFKIEYNSNFTISVNKEYLENKAEYKDLYTFKVYVDESKLKNDDYYLIRDLTEDKIKNVEIKYKHYKLQSLSELKHFANVELNNELNLDHCRCIELCNKEGNILDKTDELPKEEYYLKLDLFKSKKVKDFLNKEKVNFEEFNRNLNKIVENKDNYKDRIQKLYEEWKNYYSKFFEEHKKLDTLKERDEDYSNLRSEISDFGHRIIGALTVLQFLDNINSDLKNININGELIDEKLFKYKEEANRIVQIAQLCLENRLNYEADSNVSFQKDSINDIKKVYEKHVNENDLGRYCGNYVFNYISRDLRKDLDKKVAELSKKYDEYLKSLQVNTKYELDTSKMECKGFSKDDYINAFKQRCNNIGFKDYKKGKNIFDKIFDFMNYIAINNDPKYYFFNYFIDDEQIFDYFDLKNIVKKDIKIKIIPTEYNGSKINKNKALLYLQREKFEKEKSEEIENAKSKDDLIKSFKSIKDILNSGSFEEWNDLYKNIKFNKDKYNIDTSLENEFDTCKFPSLRKKFEKKYNGFLEAELDKEIKEGLNKLKEVYQSVLDEYKVKINTVKDIDELNNLEDINEHDLKDKIGNKPFYIEDETLKKQLIDIIGKIVRKNKEIYENTQMTYVNEILEIYKNKENEFKNAVLQEISNYYNLAVQEMKNNIKNSTNIDSLKKLRYEDKSVISTELTNKVNSKDSNLENKMKKYSISIDINTYVDDIYNEYKKKESSLKSGNKNEDSKEKVHDSVQSSEETTKKDDKVKDNKTKCCNYKKKEQ